MRKLRVWIAVAGRCTRRECLGECRKMRICQLHIQRSERLRQALDWDFAKAGRVVKISPPAMRAARDGVGFWLTSATR
jgi:hypothetical protein